VVNYFNHSPSVIARNEAIPDLQSEYAWLLTYHMVSLVAKTSLFVLIQKVTKKIKTTSMLPRSLPVLHAFFAVRYFVPHITQKAKPTFPPALARPCCQAHTLFD
jgi:hypothetical protein